MNHLLDTNVTIDCLAAMPYTTTLVEVIFRDTVFISTVSVGEVFQEIHFGRDPGAAQEAFLTFLEDVRIVPFDFEKARRYGALRGNLMKRHRETNVPLPGDADIMIAAVAMQLDATLVTRNLKHFGTIEGLRLYAFD